MFYGVDSWHQNTTIYVNLLIYKNAPSALGGAKVSEKFSVIYKISVGWDKKSGKSWNSLIKDKSIFKALF